MLDAIMHWLLDLGSALSLYSLPVIFAMAIGDVKLKYTTETQFTITSLNSNTSSATNMWCSAVVDNSADLYEDALIFVKLSFPATAPGGAKRALIYAYGSNDNADYTQPASGTEGDQTIPDYQANPTPMRQIGEIPYNTSDDTIKGGPFSVAEAFGGKLPKYWGVAVVNHTGATIDATGNEVSWVGLYHNVAAA